MKGLPEKKNWMILCKLKANITNYVFQEIPVVLISAILKIVHIGNFVSTD